MAPASPTPEDDAPRGSPSHQPSSTRQSAAGNSILQPLLLSGEIDVEAETRLYQELQASQLEDDAVKTFPSAVQQFVRQPSLHKTQESLFKSHNHGVRSIFQAESVYSAEIVLADNSGRSSGSNGFARDIKVTGWTIVGDGAGKKKGVGAYVVYDCTIWTKEGTTMHILKRYSAFEELYDSLKDTLPRHLIPSLPSLPPKAPLARFRPAFLDSRRKLLEFWLSSVLLHPEIGGAEIVRAWVLA